MIEDGKKWCTKGKHWVEVEGFTKKANGSYRSECRDCRAVYGKQFYKDNRDRLNEGNKIYRNDKPKVWRNAWYKRKYGITLEEYERMYDEQDGLCALCCKPESAADPKTKSVKRLAVDHHHGSGMVRALLCMECNTALSKFEDTPFLLSAVAYLRKYGSTVEVKVDV